jgi:hypothetical protein
MPLAPGTGRLGSRSASRATAPARYRPEASVRSALRAAGFTVFLPTRSLVMLEKLTAQRSSKKYASSDQSHPAHLNQLKTGSAQRLGAVSRLHLYQVQKSGKTFVEASVS